MTTEPVLKNENVKQVYLKFEEIVEPLILKYFHEKIKEQTRFIRAYETRYQKLVNGLKEAGDVVDMVELKRDFKKSLFDLLMKNSAGLNDINFNDFYQEFEEAIKKISEEQNKYIVERKPVEKYQLKRSDRPTVFISKIFANSKSSAVLFFKNAGNILKIILKRQPAELISIRKRLIPFRNMAYHHMLNLFMAEARKPIQRLMKAKSDSLLQMWGLDGKLDEVFQGFLQQKTKIEILDGFADIKVEEAIEKLKADNQEHITELKEMLQMLHKEAFNRFDEDILKVDTLELSSTMYHHRRINRQLNERRESIEGFSGNWKNTHFTLFDDWAVDVEITLLYYSVYDEFNQMSVSVSDFVLGDLNGAFKDILTFVNKAKTEIEQAVTTKKAVREILLNQRNKTIKELIDKILSHAIELLSSCFDDDFERLMSKTLHFVEKVSDRRAFIRSRNYQRAVGNKEMNWISPRELLHFEALPHFKKKMLKTEKQVANHLEKSRVHLLGLGTVCDFSLESSVTMIDQKDGTAKNAVNTALSGFDRAATHLRSVEDIMHNIQNLINSELREAINDFNTDILKLKDTENIFELNLKIVKIRAIEKSMEYKRKAINFIKNLAPKIVFFSRHINLKAIRLSRNIKASLGFTSEKKYVSYELSEFIGQTQMALKTLPYVYQRLYQLNPTDEDRFFVNREKEIKLLKDAMDNWKKDRFITVAVIGIKGSGITSLINYFLRHNDTSLKLIRRTLDSKIYLPDQYLDFFGGLFENQKFESNTQIIDFLNSSDGNHIIVLENLHHMFLKRVHGFDCMTMLFDLMSNTMKKVLWIGAYTRHSWEYLEKTIHISNYFTNEIFLEQMDSTTIAGIIFQRNSLSGYHIDFIPDQENIESKAFMKLDDLEKQEYLQKQFFTHLSRISGGNITLAQLYWLRSTRKVTDDSIEIGAIKEIDFTFIKNLSGDDLFALQALIIHDGLTLEDFSLVMSMPVNTVRNMLTPMLEKGLLIKPKQKYNVNPIIFKPVAGYLASRNFIN
jgi:hypothetical protein